MTSRAQLQKVISDERLGTDPKSLAKQITVTPQPCTVILNVAVRDTDPSRAERTANTLVNNFAAYVNAFPKSATAGASATPSPSATGSPSATTSPSDTESLQGDVKVVSPAVLP